jgi:hypothetical protein
VIALGAIAAGLARVGTTIAQLRELDVSSVSSARATVAQPRHDEAAQLPLAVPASTPAVVDASERPAASAEEPARETTGDPQIMRWLAEDAELARAADELLRDPDPAVQAEARAFLRAVGFDVGENGSASGAAASGR